MRMKSKIMEVNDAYRKLFLVAKIKIVTLNALASHPVQQLQTVPASLNVHSTLKLSKIELPKFNGVIKKLLPF